MTPKGKHTLIHIKTALQSGEAAPALNQILEIIRDLSSRPESVSVSDLADAIAKDVSIASKILIAANTIYFNHSGNKISTLTEAINTIGLHEVRSLTIALLLMHPMQDEIHQQEVREISALAITSGLLSQFLSTQSGFENPEQAFLCASLRYYGRLLLASFCIDDYRNAVNRCSAEITLDEAFEEVLGITPLALGSEIAKELNLHPMICRSMGDLPIQKLTRKPENDEDRFVLLSDLSMRLCTALEENHDSSDDLQEALVKTTRVFERMVSIDSTSMRQLFLGVQNELKRYEQVYHLKPLSASFIKHLSQASKVHIEFSSTTSHATSPTEAQNAKGDPQEIFIKGLEDVTDALSSDSPNLEQIYDLVVHTIHAGLGLKNTLLMTQMENDSLYTVRTALGENAFTYQTDFSINPLTSDVFGVCLSKAEDTVLQNLDDPKLINFLPDWHRNLSKAKSLMILPLKDGPKIVGLIYGEKDQAYGIDLKPEIHRHLKSLKNQIRIARRLSS